MRRNNLQSGLARMSDADKKTRDKAYIKWECLKTLEDQKIKFAAQMDAAIIQRDAFEAESNPYIIFRRKVSFIEQRIINIKNWWKGI